MQAAMNAGNRHEKRKAGKFVRARKRRAPAVVPVSSSVKKVVPPLRRLTRASAPRCSNREKKNRDILDPTWKLSDDHLKGWVTRRHNEAGHAVLEEEERLCVVAVAGTLSGKYRNYITELLTNATDLKEEVEKGKEELILARLEEKAERERLT